MMKTATRLNTIKTIVVAVAVIAVAALVWWLTRSVSDSGIAIEADNKIDLTPEQIQSIKAIGEWEFLSVADEEMVDTLRRGLFSDDRLTRIYYGVMRLGVNLHKVKPGWIKASGDSVTVMLPPVELLDEDFIDEARTRSFYESGRWTASDREAMYMRAHRMMKKRGLTRANMNSAVNNADAQMRRLMRSMGFNHITIRFEGK